MTLNCVGCINIQERSFPFGNETWPGENGKFYIDTEGCGVTQSDHILQIFFCPVCGTKLSDERVRLSIDEYLEVEV